MQNPSLLSLGEGDHLEAMYQLPYHLNEVTHEIETVKNSPPSPFWLSYGGCPAPIGVGMAVQLVKDQPVVINSLSFGIERVQFGYILKQDPINDRRLSQYALRVGGAEGFAAALSWGDEASIAGIGFRQGGFTAELDGTFSLEFTDDPIYTLAIGAAAEEKAAMVIGYASSSKTVQKFSDEKIFLGLNGKFTKTFSVNLYHRQYFGEFVISILADL
jgi:hypothetical protein